MWWPRSFSRFGSEVNDKAVLVRNILYARQLPPASPRPFLPATRSGCMPKVVRFPIRNSFVAGQAAHGRGWPLAANPFAPGTFEYTQWVIGHQWGPARSEPVR